MAKAYGKNWLCREQMSISEQVQSAFMFPRQHPLFLPPRSPERDCGGFPNTQTLAGAPAVGWCLRQPQQSCWRCLFSGKWTFPSESEPLEV